MQAVRIGQEQERQVVTLYRRGLSEPLVARRLGICHATVHYVLVRNNEPRRSISEACTKYPKTNFSGDLAEQALICGFINDCSVIHDGKQIRIQTSTTHPAQIERIDELFGGYGCVTRTPTFNKSFSIYQWCLRVYVNPTFDFLIEYKKKPMNYVTKFAENGKIYDYLTEMAEADNCIGFDSKHTDHRLYCWPVVEIGNRNKDLLDMLQGIIGGTVFHTRTVHVLKLRNKLAVETLGKLSLTHGEKVALKQLILSHTNKGRTDVKALIDHKVLRRRIDEEVQSCTLQGRLEWLRRHGKPHKDDSDQTIPPELALSSLFLSHD